MGEYASGDADLYGRENEYPIIEDSNCEEEICTLCRSRSYDDIDTCSHISTTNGSYFYAMVVAHKDFTGGKVTFSAINLKNVAELDVPTTTTTTTTTTPTVSTTPISSSKVYVPRSLIKDGIV